MLPAVSWQSKINTEERSSTLILMSYSIFSRAVKFLFLLFFLLQSSFSQKLQERKARDRSYDILHIKLNLNFDQKTKTLFAEAVETVVPRKPNVRSLELDAANLQVKKISLANGKNLLFASSPSQLQIQLDRMYSPMDTVNFVILYEVHYPEKGIYFIEPDEDDPQKPHQIWSQNWAEDAHCWFPCIDDPNEKCTFEVVTTVKDLNAVVANGRLTELKEDAEHHTKTFHWVQDRPIHPAVQAIAVGEFTIGTDSLQGIPIQYYVHPSRAADVPRSFSKTREMLKFFSDKIGFFYPWAKYANVALADFTIYGGMENASNSFITDATLHDERAHLDVRSEGVVSHELAHQWWGDLVTVKDWSEMWLSEGFATYFASLWREHELGKDEFRYDLWQQANSYIHEDTARYHRPIVFKDYQYADSMLNAHTYPGGSRRLHMLRFVLGEDLFWKALNHYAHKFAFGNAGTDDLEAAVEEVAGRKLNWFFDEWLYQAGFPKFEVKYSWSAISKTVQLFVKQTQTVDSLTPLFTTPVDVEIITPTRRQTYQLLVERGEQEFSFPAEEKPLMVTFDKGNWIVKTLKFTKSQEELFYQLKSDEDVVGRIQAAQWLLDQYRLDKEVLTHLREALLHDPFWGVRAELVKLLKGKTQDDIKQLLMEAYKDRSSRVRRAVVEALGNFGGEDVADVLTKAVLRDDSYYVVALALKSLARMKALNAYEILKGALKQDSYQDVIRAGAIESLAILKDARAGKILLEYASPGHLPRLRIAALKVLRDFKDSSTLPSLQDMEKKEKNKRIRSEIQTSLKALQTSINSSDHK